MSLPSTSLVEDDAELKQVAFRFCSECSNMLYPKEDVDARELHFTCRTCHYTEKAKSNCIFRNILNNTAGETAGVTQDVSSDPTVSHETDGLLRSRSLGELCVMCGCVLPAVSVDESLQWIDVNLLNQILAQDMSLSADSNDSPWKNATSLNDLLCNDMFMDLGELECLEEDSDEGESLEFDIDMDGLEPAWGQQSVITPVS